MSIEIIGLGAGDINQLPLGIYRKLIKTNKKIFSRTNEHPVIKELLHEGVKFESFDQYYEESEAFSDVYFKIADTLLEQAKDASIIYVVPGHPMIAEQTVQHLLAQKNIEVNIKGGQSFLDDMFNRLRIDPIEGFQMVDGTNFSRDELNYEQHIVFAQVYDSYIASEVKLALLEDLPADHEVMILIAVGSEDEKIIKLPLSELDHQLELNNLMSVYVPPVSKADLRHTFNSFKTTVAELRGPNGCEWDKKQTHDSLKKYALEEVHELINAINNKDDVNLIEELGDVLLQVMLHSQIGEDDGYFTIDDVIKGVNEKMIRRHPHVFGDVKANTVEEINENWEKIKREESPKQSSDSILDDIIGELPSLQRAYELKRRVKKTGFDWSHVDHLWAKLDEELAEFKEAVISKDVDEMELELGDVLFVVADIAQYYSINPELALMRVNEKFIFRFKHIEAGALINKKEIHELTSEEMKQFWNEAKQKE